MYCNLYPLSVTLHVYTKRGAELSLSQEVRKCMSIINKAMNKVLYP